VNGLAPDVTVTEGIRNMSAPGFEDRTSLMIPMGRLGHVDETAGVAVFLASGLSSYVTGHTIHVDGGTAAAFGWYHDPADGHYILGPSVRI
jgi:NAD(P)-dependent dehydrogenase (short-subunit alcohol dehydrogenase family)